MARRFDGGDQKCGIDLVLKYNRILGLILERSSTNHCKNFKQFTAQCKWHVNSC